MKKYDNFCNALKNLSDIYKYNEPYENVIMTGLVGLFDVCFEQSWKAMKELLQRDGFSEGQTGSPRQILKTAYQAGMISDEQLWLAALSARNNVTHAYNKEIALDIISDTKNRFFDMFTELQKTLDKDWI